MVDKSGKEIATNLIYKPRNWTLPKRATPEHHEDEPNRAALDSFAYDMDHLNSILATHGINVVACSRNEDYDKNKGDGEDTAKHDEEDDSLRNKGHTKTDEHFTLLELTTRR